MAFEESCFLSFEKKLFRGVRGQSCPYWFRGGSFLCRSADFCNKGDGVLGRRRVELRSIVLGMFSLLDLPELGSSSTSRVKIGIVGIVFPAFLPDTRLVEFLEPELVPGQPPPKQLPKSIVDMDAARTVGSLVQVVICAARGPLQRSLSRFREGGLAGSKSGMRNNLELGGGDDIVISFDK